MINISDHYWSIAGSANEVYQSKTNTLVTVGDADYQAWIAGHGELTPILNETELANVLLTYRTSLPAWLMASPLFIQPAPGTYSQDQLKAYSADARWRKQSGGIVVNGIPFPTDSVALGALNSAFVYTGDKEVNAFSWKLPDGTFITIDTQGVKDVQNAVSLFWLNCFACEDQTAARIDDGSFNNLPSIDAAYAAVSNEFTGAVQRRVK